MEQGSKPPLPTTPVLMSVARHVARRCTAQNKAFMECKRSLRDPEKCLDEGHQVMGCVSSLIKELHATCGKEMESYTGCMDYYSKDLEMCRQKQKEFEAACPLPELS
ncbi:hypothetical protein SELMODRAFT_149059 [Selaginella moellendorffii]|uniref:CHCH domain-containing protein n=1 Tax=Selaginella moellendorffii TaxID=88036 RepID=D8RQG6_SELML|nr:NADH dehydrogenase [ubiquinone] 1 alpha subcomplex subunit 8-A [Selaginella moellendorffii]EFJ12296.1 hypothetical protein SELMODRAFT_124541 [Selaginella moellendorffii]EFJ25651.1 hypothetical protein SELMODRAFT_149059 [Selaginella moellendorffii]|eukprot:XP_002973277.1 NADH dehydrogenase [ubiquinone] 1 alpha subcomplex subunit 8-A [Selaginella moellendorffii]